MIDIKLIRENKDLVKENIKKKLQDEKLPLVDEVYEMDKRVREVQVKADGLKADKNRLSGEIGKLMKDGKKPGESTKYIYNSVDDPFKDRDPRLDFTVLHNGSRWLNTSLDTQVGGTHNPSGAQYSRTCYYIAKFMKDYQASSNYDDDTHLWVMYRYGEVLLNYAEALNEVALSGGTIDKNEVINSLAQLRKRAGIEPGDDNNYGLPTPENYDATEMRDIIRNERRIEMAFEEQRYWDIRRWRIAETIFKKPLRGLSIQIVGNKTNYYEVDVLSAGFDTKRYFYPIPYSEVIKNGNMIQNPNW